MEDETKNCQNCKNDFVIESEDFNFYEKIKVPPPTFCPECRFIRRLCWRNERSLYKRKCDICDKNLISMYDKDVIFPVYCPECWKSDKWDPIEYGQEYNFNKPFFEQWRELFLKVPRQSVWQVGNCKNTEYANFSQDVKNIYLAYSIVWGSEDVSYSSNVDSSKIIIDSYNILNSELLYENIGSTKNYNCQYTYWSSSCIDCSFILDCANCSNCFGCVNLRNKHYCIWNIQFSKEKYFEKIKELNMGSYKFTKNSLKEFWEFSLQFPRKYGRIINCINSIGDEIRDSKNSHFVFNAYNIENVKYAYRSPHTKDSMDVSHTGTVELAYEHAFGGSDNSNSVAFIIGGAPGLNNVQYCDYCYSSSYLFGCIGLKSKLYYILNKQYKKEDYFRMIEKIKKHMDEMPYVDNKGRVYKYGEFFPYEFCPHGYNESVANDHFPLMKEEIVERGYHYKNKIENKYTITKKASELPDDIKNVDDSILNEVIECEVTKKAFKITPFELQFYRRMNIPIPRIHQDERYVQRLKLRNPMKLWHRQCMCDKTNHLHGDNHCEVEFETSYAPDRPEIVYCEKCYNQEIY